MLALAIYPVVPDYDEQRIKLVPALKPMERLAAEDTLVSQNFARLMRMHRRKA
jgi:hypothetical protein